MADLERSVVESDVLNALTESVDNLDSPRHVPRMPGEGDDVGETFCPADRSRGKEGRGECAAPHMREVPRRAPPKRGKCRGGAGWGNESGLSPAVSVQHTPAVRKSPPKTRDQRTPGLLQAPKAQLMTTQIEVGPERGQEGSRLHRRVDGGQDPPPGLAASCR